MFRPNKLALTRSNLEGESEISTQGLVEFVFDRFIERYAVSRTSSFAAIDGQTRTVEGSFHLSQCWFNFDFGRIEVVSQVIAKFNIKRIVSCTATLFVTAMLGDFEWAIRIKSEFMWFLREVWTFRRGGTIN